MTGNVLFPTIDARFQGENLLTNLLSESAQRVVKGPVTATLNLEAFKKELVGFDFSRPMKFTDLLEWTIARMETGIVHVNHPRYLGLFNPAPVFPAQCADRIAAAYNPQLASATTSPAAVEIEAHVIRAVAKRAGLPPQTTGHFTSGGSEANYTAVICALTQAQSGFATIGARAFTGQPVFYISQDSHLVWIKIAHQAGIGRAAARQIPTDGYGRMDANALKNAIELDRAAGNVPFMVAATAGTTNAGMIDPLESCFEIARNKNLWLHVDAAWGGAAIASEKLRGLLAGLELADSVTIDAHKWFATTMGCGMFLTIHPRVLSAAFNVSVSFMPSGDQSLDPYLTTAQWSRRFLGLRLFLVLAAGGWAAYEAHVEHTLGLTKYLCEILKQSGWSVVNELTLGVACLLPPGGSAPVIDIVSKIVSSGAAWVSVAKFEGQEVIRACVTHGETSRSDILDIIAYLEQFRLCKPLTPHQVETNGSN